MMQAALLDFAEITRMLQVALGIGAIIFVHELGHFLAARLCGVRVEIFSLGFGPRILGWKRGATTYQLAAIPMGGFVKMAGEEQAPGGTPAPDELPAKSVGQRFFIYSGGVLMNVLFALVVFPPILFFGVPFPEPVIGSVNPGGPAWRAGLEPGTRVLAIDGEPIVSFEDLHTNIGLSSAPTLEFRVRRPGASADETVLVEPGYRESQGLRSIEVGGAADPQGKLTIEPGSPAFEAGLRDGDRLVGAQGLGYDAATRAMWRMGRGEPLEVEVERGHERITVRIEPRVEPPNPKSAAGKLRLLSAMAACNRVVGLRGDEAARLGLKVDDRLLAVAGKPILRDGDFELALSAAVGSPFELQVEREGAELVLPSPALDAAAASAAARAVALIADIDGTRVAVIPLGAAATAGIQDGDRIVRLGTRATARWTDVQAALKAEAADGATVQVNVERRGEDGKPRYLDFDVRPGPAIEPIYGLQIAGAMYEYRASSFADAIRIGVQNSAKIMADIARFLAGLFRGSVSSDHLGGIISITQGSYLFAELGFTKLVFFLCMLSLNLAFINVLPIPVLDGGHLFFLVIEKLKGSPVSERVLGYSQMVGLVLILGLVVFVTFNDLQRLFGN